jgi:hypothetical protein
MAENMMNSAHKATNEVYRNEYDRIFKTSKKGRANADVCVRSIRNVKKKKSNK